MSPVIQMYDHQQKGQRLFVPIDQSHIKMYVCGPTVYSYAHLGNARSAVVFDVWNRLLRSQYDQVTYVRNITDVDDKIYAASVERGVPISEITEEFTRHYHHDMAQLGCLSPDYEPKATAFIDQMIALTQLLVSRGHAYEEAGHVCFHASSYQDYGTLSGRLAGENQRAGARVAVASYKKDPLDFVLWKPSTDDEPGWDSPWGRGRPGWHTECAAMTTALLGLPFDVHGGGEDLLFPHHENESAQACAAYEQGFSRYWLHNGMMTVEGQKMSKSLGNIKLVKDLLAEVPGDVLRYAMLRTHYRHALDWTSAGLAQAKTALMRLYRALDSYPSAWQVDASVDSGVLAALCQDLNTPLALTRLTELAASIANDTDAGVLVASAQLMGLMQLDPVQWHQALLVRASLDESTIADYIEQRRAARVRGDYAEADRIRQTLLDHGVTISDGGDGVSDWHFV